VCEGRPPCTARRPRPVRARAVPRSVTAAAGEDRNGSRCMCRCHRARYIRVSSAAGPACPFQPARARRIGSRGSVCSCATGRKPGCRMAGRTLKRAAPPSGSPFPWADSQGWVLWTGGAVTAARTRCGWPRGRPGGAARPGRSSVWLSCLRLSSVVRYNGDGAPRVVGRRAGDRDGVRTDVGSRTRRPTMSSAVLESAWARWARRRPRRSSRRHRRPGIRRASSAAPGSRDCATPPRV
jgi:hypothetical protein